MPHALYVLSRADFDSYYEAFARIQRMVFPAVHNGASRWLVAVPSRLPGHQQHVDLFQLYQHIVSMGGLGSYNSAHLAWHHLAERGVAGVEPNAVRGKELRKVYAAYLQSFPDWLDGVVQEYYLQQFLQQQQQHLQAVPQRTMEQCRQQQPQQLPLNPAQPQQPQQQSMQVRQRQEQLPQQAPRQHQQQLGYEHQQNHSKPPVTQQLMRFVSQVSDKPASIPQQEHHQNRHHHHQQGQQQEPHGGSHLTQQLMHFVNKVLLKPDKESSRDPRRHSMDQQHAPPAIERQELLSTTHQHTGPYQQQQQQALDKARQHQPLQQEFQPHLPKTYQHEPRIEQQQQSFNTVHKQQLTGDNSKADRQQQQQQLAKAGLRRPLPWSLPGGEACKRLRLCGAAPDNDFLAGDAAAAQGAVDGAAANGNRQPLTAAAAAPPPPPSLASAGWPTADAHLEAMPADRNMQVMQRARFRSRKNPNPQPRMVGALQPPPAAPARQQHMQRHSNPVDADNPSAEVLLFLQAAAQQLPVEGSTPLGHAAMKDLLLLSDKHRPLLDRVRNARLVTPPADAGAAASEAGEDTENPAGDPADRTRAASAGAPAPSQDGVRRSRRKRVQPSFYLPEPLQVFENPYAIKTSPRRQAEVPPLRQQPQQPTASEARYLGTLIHTLPAAEEATDSSAVMRLNRAFKRLYKAAASDEARRELLQQWVCSADHALGADQVEALGLSRLGYKLLPEWPLAQQLLFALGMMDTKYRNFPERRRGDRIDYGRIQRRYLPEQSINQLNGFYYNVWKSVASPLAQEFDDTIASPSRAFLDALIGGYRTEFEAAVQLADPQMYRYHLLSRLASAWDSSSMGPLPEAVMAEIEDTEVAWLFANHLPSGSDRYGWPAAAAAAGGNGHADTGGAGTSVRVGRGRRKRSATPGLASTNTKDIGREADGASAAVTTEANAVTATVAAAVAEAPTATAITTETSDGSELAAAAVAKTSATAMAGVDTAPASAAEVPTTVATAVTTAAGVAAALAAFTTAAETPSDNKTLPVVTAAASTAEPSREPAVHVPVARGAGSGAHEVHMDATRDTSGKAQTHPATLSSPQTQPHRAAAAAATLQAPSAPLASTGVAAGTAAALARSGAAQRPHAVLVQLPANAGGGAYLLVPTAHVNPAGHPTASQQRPAMPLGMQQQQHHVQARVAARPLAPASAAGTGGQFCAGPAPHMLWSPAPQSQPAAPGVYLALPHQQSAVLTGLDPAGPQQQRPAPHQQPPALTAGVRPTGQHRQLHNTVSMLTTNSATGQHAAAPAPADLSKQAEGGATSSTLLPQEPAVSHMPHTQRSPRHAPVDAAGTAQLAMPGSAAAATTAEQSTQLNTAAAVTTVHLEALRLEGSTAAAGISGTRLRASAACQEVDTCLSTPNALLDPQPRAVALLQQRLLELQSSEAPTVSGVGAQPGAMPAGNSSSLGDATTNPGVSQKPSSQPAAALTDQPPSSPAGLCPTGSHPLSVLAPLLLMYKLARQPEHGARLGTRQVAQLKRLRTVSQCKEQQQPQQKASDPGTGVQASQQCAGAHQERSDLAAAPPAVSTAAQAVADQRSQSALNSRQQADGSLQPAAAAADAGIASPARKPTEAAQVADAADSSLLQPAERAALRRCLQLLHKLARSPEHRISKVRVQQLQAIRAAQQQQQQQNDEAQPGCSAPLMSHRQSAAEPHQQKHKQASDGRQQEITLHDLNAPAAARPVELRLPGQPQAPQHTLLHQGAAAGNTAAVVATPPVTSLPSEVLPGAQAAAAAAPRDGQLPGKQQLRVLDLSDAHSEPLTGSRLGQQELRPGELLTAPSASDDQQPPQVPAHQQGGTSSVCAPAGQALQASAQTPWRPHAGAAAAGEGALAQAGPAPEAAKLTRALHKPLKQLQRLGVQPDYFMQLTKTSRQQLTRMRDAVRLSQAPSDAGGGVCVLNPQASLVPLPCGSGRLRRVAQQPRVSHGSPAHVQLGLQVHSAALAARTDVVVQVESSALQAPSDAGPAGLLDTNKSCPLNLLQQKLVMLRTLARQPVLDAQLTVEDISLLKQLPHGTRQEQQQQH